MEDEIKSSRADLVSMPGKFSAIPAPKMIGIPRDEECFPYL
jgi:hypothetical protein